MKIIISRTDNLGDVVLTLPLAGFFKGQNPDNQVVFIGKNYTQAIIESSVYVDKFLAKEAILANPNLLAQENADAILFVFPDVEIAQIAKKTKIPTRIGTSHRWWHWLYCNKKVSFSRKNSNLHEAQLNFKLLEGLDLFLEPNFGLIQDWYGLKTPQLPENLQNLLSQEKVNIILHPKSKGSAREWHLDNYYALAKQNSDKQFFITGTQAEGELVLAQKPQIFELPNVKNLTGKLLLQELIAFIGAVEGIVACSTGPLHIAAALGKYALGIYPPIRPMHPGRWQPIGKKAKVLVLSKECSACRKSNFCACINAISVTEVSQEIAKWQKEA
ncbi:glycosyltransferase family 9 protein [Raineya orbicola]|jgi:ADP-heptose:LPS heptosyltransferase|uniref:ADP-heptose:LPS heptosyltransferase n=1 Tax=Raineya orbicola TaxID=2016530 RepID=A0A2N3IJQ8_9BACT|nr:glycosyltransferase family 9 protein [Raineya orbicola]PKQ70546.1 ADP-heptose:LPS heptosyltransferase [Raineya orbicola]